jgi:RND family efflux transporter MFP subunit
MRRHSEYFLITAVLLPGLSSNAWAVPGAVSIVQISNVVRMEIAPTVSVPGTIYSRNDVRVTAGVAGQLVMVAEPGTVVGKGEPVARIDDAPLRLQRAEQEALLERAEINVRQLDSQLRRQSELRNSSLVSEFELEQTEANRDLARSDANITRVRIRQIDDLIARTVAKAQFTGIVIERLRREGEDVGHGEILAQMTDIENMEVRAFVPLKHLPRTTVGDSISVFAGDTLHKGQIRALIPTGDVRSQTFEARIDLPPGAMEQWTIGQLVSVAVPIRQKEPALTVPRDALVLRQDGSFVYRINGENRAERVRVELGDSEGQLIAVIGSLQEGDRIAIRGAENLSDGAEVRIVLPETATVETAPDDG